MLGMSKVALFCVSAAALLAWMPEDVSAYCPNGCNAQGTCGKNDKCTCYERQDQADETIKYPAFKGADCSMRTCPYGEAWVQVPSATNTAHQLAECSNRGLCDYSTGHCTCFPGYEGKACERSECPNNCNGRGICLTLQAIIAGSPDKTPLAPSYHPGFMLHGMPTSTWAATATRAIAGRTVPSRSAPAATTFCSHSAKRRAVTAAAVANATTKRASASASQAITAPHVSRRPPSTKTRNRSHQTGTAAYREDNSQRTPLHCSLHCSSNSSSNIALPTSVLCVKWSKSPLNRYIRCCVCCIATVRLLYLLNDELVDAPVLERVVGQVPADDDGDFALAQLLHGDLERVRLALNVYHHRRVHGDLQGARPQHAGALVLGHVAGRNAVRVGLFVGLVQHLHLVLLVSCVVSAFVQIIRRDLLLEFLLRDLLVLHVAVVGLVVLLVHGVCCSAFRQLASTQVA